MKENSFESAQSDLDFDQYENKISRNSFKINESKEQIRKSLMFSKNIESSDINIINNNDIFKNQKLVENFGLNKNKIENLNSSRNTKLTPFLEILDKKNTKIVLVKVIDQNYFEGHLRLKNNLKSEYLIFKILNEKQIYSITPCLYYIEPGKDIVINIKRFEKLTINETKNVLDYLIVIIAHTKNKIEDVNDAKIYINKNDIYSPDYQLYSYSITLDYGFNYKIYEKEEKERKNIFDKYESQLNINRITDVEKIKKYINNVKKDIEIYQNKISDLKSILNDIGKKNIFVKDKFYQISKGESL